MDMLCYVDSVARCCQLAARSLRTFHLVVSMCCDHIPSRGDNSAGLICSSEPHSAPSDIQPCTDECHTIVSCVPWSVL